MPGTGQAVGAKHVLHARLVAEIACGLRSHAGEPECVTQLSEWHLEVFERPEESVDGAEVARELPEPDVDALRR